MNRGAHCFNREITTMFAAHFDGTDSKGFEVSRGAQLVMQAPVGQDQFAKTFEMLARFCGFHSFI